jgi:cytochrome c peroxidase
MGKGKCGTCHFAPLFNGNTPPSFLNSESEVIGVPENADTINSSIDDDDGKYNLYGIELHKNAFKTSTLRNITLTAPYMHNGVYNTLEEVIEFYNRGGGAGLGIKLENQTLPDDKLHLTSEEKKALLVFMESLTDSVTREIKYTFITKP